MGDGSELWRYPGLNRPPDAEGVRWGVERVGRRRFQGREVDVLAYVAQVAEGRGARAPAPYAQADFVDPSTGEVVGGLDGWGRESFPAELESAPGCSPR